LLLQADSSNCRNQKYEAISGGFVADDVVSSEPVSATKFPAIREFNREFWENWPNFGCPCRGKRRDFNRMEIKFPTQSNRVFFRANREGKFRIREWRAGNQRTYAGMNRHRLSIALPLLAG